MIRPLIAAGEVTTSILCYGEVVEYLKGFNDFDSRHRQLRQMLRAIYPYSLTYSILARYADIRRQLRPQHGPGLIGDIDTLIAATALDRGLTFITADSDFDRVPALDLMRVTLRN